MKVARLWFKSLAASEAQKDCFQWLVELLVKSYVTAHYQVHNRSCYFLKDGKLEWFHARGRLSLYAIYARATNVIAPPAKRKPQSEC